MISKEKFIEFLETYRALDLKETRLNEALEEFCGEPTMVYSGGLGLALDILAESMGDHDGLIVSFVYDANYGAAEDANYTINGKVVAIRSIGELYDALTGNV